MNIKFHYFVILQGQKNYLFRLDKKRVIDGTVKGGIAKFINHSCTPNSTTEEVEENGKLKILIRSIRQIKPGDEVCVFAFREFTSF